MMLDYWKEDPSSPKIRNKSTVKSQKLSISPFLPNQEPKTQVISIVMEFINSKEGNSEEVNCDYKHFKFGSTD